MAKRERLQRRAALRALSIGETYSQAFSFLKGRGPNTPVIDPPSRDQRIFESAILQAWGELQTLNPRSIRIAHIEPKSQSLLITLETALKVEPRTRMFLPMPDFGELEECIRGIPGLRVRESSLDSHLDFVHVALNAQVTVGPFLTENGAGLKHLLADRIEYRQNGSFRTMLRGEKDDYSYLVSTFFDSMLSDVFRRVGIIKNLIGTGISWWQSPQGTHVEVHTVEPRSSDILYALETLCSEDFEPRLMISGRADSVLARALGRGIVLLEPDSGRKVYIRFALT